VFAGFALLALAGCDLSPGPSQPSMGSDLLIGVPMSLTGSQSKEGALSKQGYDLWADWVNGKGGITAQGVRHRVQLRYVDDQSKADASAQVTQQLISDQKVSFLLGPYGSSATAADAPIAEQNHVPFISTNGAAQAIFSHGYRYVFGVMSPASKYLQGVLDMAASMTPKPITIAMLSADDSFSVEVAKAVVDYAPRVGLQVVYSQSYPNGSTNLYAQIGQAKQKNPDILLNSGHLVEAIAINKAAKDLRLGAKIYAYSVGPATPDFAQALGNDSNFVFSGSQWSPEIKYRQTMYISAPEYVQAYQQKFGTKDQPAYQPAYQVADATAGGLALQAAIEHSNSLDAEKVRDALGALDIITFYGRIKFDQTGLNTFKPMVVEQIQNGRLATVWPLEMATAKALYPTPTWLARAGPMADATPAKPPPKVPATGLPPRPRNWD
jgi:branched-chain amino acid transport system substrate-binding protein